MWYVITIAQENPQGALPGGLQVANETDNTLKLSDQNALKWPLIADVIAAFLSRVQCQTLCKNHREIFLSFTVRTLRIIVPDTFTDCHANNSELREYHYAD